MATFMGCECLLSLSVDHSTILCVSNADHGVDVDQYLDVPE